MRQVKVWRYYCDHCGKGGCGKGAMAKHERSCVRNPDRDCRMCPRGCLVQQPIATLIEAAHSIDALREAADGCPACMLAGAIQAHPGGYTPSEEDGYYDPRTFVDFKAEAARFWADVNEAEADERPW